MDYAKTGALIRRLRKEKHMTQKELADALGVSDKAVSKWERACGLPDVSLLEELSVLLEVRVEKLLSGTLDPNESDGGNMKRIKFYVCPECKNVITSTGAAEVSCCGRTLQAECVKKPDDEHPIGIEEADDEYLVTVAHEMTKEHCISFIAYVTWDSVLLVKLYPEQDAQIRVPRMRRGTWYYYCSRHGMYQK